MIPYSENIKRKYKYIRFSCLEHRASWQKGKPTSGDGQYSDKRYIRNLSYYTSDNAPQQHILGTPLTSKISSTSDERTRLMGNIINDVGGTTDWSGLTEIKFDSGYEIKCSVIDSASNLQIYLVPIQAQLI